MLSKHFRLPKIDHPSLQQARRLITYEMALAPKVLLEFSSSRIIIPRRLSICSAYFFFDASESTRLSAMASAAAFFKRSLSSV